MRLKNRADPASSAKCYLAAKRFPATRKRVPYEYRMIGVIPGNEVLDIMAQKRDALFHSSRHGQ